jgi:uncharacterized protein (TIGR02145 family)
MIFSNYIYMKYFLKITSYLFLSVVLMEVLPSCNKERGSVLGVSTSTVTEITYHSAVSGVEWSGDADYPQISWGLCLDTVVNPMIIKTNIGALDRTWRLEDLAPNTTYHVRAFVRDRETTFGEDIEFKTLPFDRTILFNPALTYSSLTDIDGNTYKTIQIGTQLWMAENLRVTKYRDGSSIPLVENEKTWFNSTLGAYCLYRNGIDYGTTFGALYNFYSVADERKLCPSGWHIPTNSEWGVLATYLGGESVAGIKLREAGILHWDYSDTGITNETGFSALPGGCRVEGFHNIGFSGIWWSSTIQYNTTVLITGISYSSTYLSVGKEAVDLNAGMSVRCLKDN